MLDKLKFNNLVISNKVKIEQSRIQTINKVVQKLRKLKVWLERKPEDGRAKEGMRKFTEVMLSLKKFKRIEIMKNVLVINKSPNAIITNGRATPEEVAVALLATNKVMQDLVQRFREALNLRGADRSWEQDIMETSKRKTKRIKTEEKRQKRKESKEQKEINRKRLEWLKSNRTDEADDCAPNCKEVKDIAVSSTGAWAVEELPLKNDRSTQKLSNTSGKESSNNTHNKVKDVVDPAQNTELNVDAAPLRMKELQYPEPAKIPAEVNTPKERTTTEEIENYDEESGGPSYVVDPFFITDTGENYISTAVKRKDKPQGKEVSREVADNSSHPKNIIKNLNYESASIGRANNTKSGSYSLKQGKRDQVKNQQSTNENVHPSWAAKQKLKPIISSFQGKKITFNDDDGSPQGNMQVPEKLAVASEKIPKATTAAAELHPSWAAKQKLKPVITQFQGKKIKFDNDDDV